MRSILTIFIACSLIQPFTLAAQSSAIKQQGVSSSEQKNSQTPTKNESNGSNNGRSNSRSNSNSKEPLDFSGTGRPGQQTAGESRGSCPNASRLEALLPVSKSGMTVQGHPSFWVYFADAFPVKSQVEFIIQNEDREDIWRSRLQSDNQPGYKRFSLPETESPLEIGQWYRWYAKIFCDSQVASAQYVQGWIKRIPLNSQLYLELQQNTQSSHLIYGNHRIWYDAVDQFLSTYQENPPNLALEQDWQNLVGAKGVDLEQLPSIKGSYEAVEPSTVNIMIE